MHQNILYVIGLFDLDAYAHAIHRWLYEDLFILIAGDVEGIKKDFGGARGFNFRDIVAFRCL